MRFPGLAISFGVLCCFRLCTSQTDSCDFQTSVSRDEVSDQLQPPANCMSGSFAWYYPRGSVDITFPRSLLPSNSRKKMKVCLSSGIGDGLARITQVMKRRSKPLSPLRSDSSDAPRVWLCSRPSRSRNGISLTLQAKDEQFYLQALQYRVEEVTRSRGSDNRRPGRRPGRRRDRNGRRDRDRGGKHTFPLGHGDYPVDSVRRDPELTDPQK